MDIYEHDSAHIQRERGTPLSVFGSKNHGISKEAFLIFCLIAAGYFYAGLQRISAASVLPHLALDYGFSAALVGFLSSLFYYSYGFLQNVWGAINDRIGPMRACSIGLAIAGLGSLIMLAGHTPFVIALSRVICGLGVGAMFTGVYLYAALMFPARQYPFWAGCIMMTGNLGSVAAVAPLGYVMDKVGYNGLYSILAVLAFLLAAPLWFFRNRIQHGDDAPDGEKVPLVEPAALYDDLKLGVKLLLSYRPLFVIVTVWAVLSAAMHTLQGLWGVSWISVSCGITLAEARYHATFISIGLVLGSPIGVTLRFLSRNGKTSLFCIVSAICAAWFLFIAGSYVHLSSRTMGLLGFFIGAATGAGMVFCSSTIRSLADIKHTGLVMGTGNTLIYLLVIIFQWGSGLVINHFPSGTPGSYLNEGYIISFALTTSIIVFTLTLITTVKTFNRKEHGDEREQQA